MNPKSVLLIIPKNDGSEMLNLALVMQRPHTTPFSFWTSTSLLKSGNCLGDSENSPPNYSARFPFAPDHNSQRKHDNLVTVPFVMLFFKYARVRACVCRA